MRRFQSVLFFVFLLPLISCASSGKNVTLNSRLGIHEEPVIRVLVSKNKRGGIVQMPMETYLAGVIGSEMSSRWPAEALKAQAVAARSYALYRMEDARKSGRRFDVVSTQADQVFKPVVAKNPYLQEIVSQTRGEVLEKKGDLVQAFYSSTCGGWTRSALLAGLATDSPLIHCKQDAYCEISPFRNWTVRTSLAEIERTFKRKGIKVKHLKSIEVSKKDDAGYVQEITYEDSRGRWTLDGNSFRWTMGSYRVKSLLFSITHHSPEIDIRGHGFGHGVGLCQYGAKQMADMGAGYKKILSTYYPKISVSKIY